MRGEWYSERLKPLLRDRLLLVAMIVEKYGGRMKVAKLLGEGIYGAGCAADVVLLGLPVYEDGAKGWAERHDPEHWPRRIVEDINSLWPLSDGSLETALLVGPRVRLRIPISGYLRPDSLGGAAWHRFGAPRRAE